MIRCKGEALGPVCARWVIVREGHGRDAVTLRYDNLVSGNCYYCGSLSSDVDDLMIVTWICEFGRPAAGDEIQFSDGNRVRWTPSGLQLREVKLDSGLVVSTVGAPRA